jgi:hypothetical protein
MINKLDISSINKREKSPNRKLDIILNLHKNNKKNADKPIRSLDMSMTSNASDLIKMLNNQPSTTIVPFDDYVSIINDTMARYQTDRNMTTLTKEIEEEDDLGNISLEEELKIRKVFTHNSSMLSQYRGTTEESILKVNIFDPEYKDPFESLRIIRKNKRIHDKVNHNFLARQRQFYDEAIEKYKSYSMKYKVKMPKIKITPILPKAKFIEIDNNPHINEEISLDKETSKDLKRGSIKLKPLREKNQLSLPLIPKEDNDLKLFSYYRYSNKNFPEGREQFVFSYDLTDIVLIGGMGSNVRNNNVWTLNPGI